MINGFTFFLASFGVYFVAQSIRLLWTLERLLMQKHNRSINKTDDSDPYLTNEHLNERRASGSARAGTDNGTHKRAIKEHNLFFWKPMHGAGA